MNDTVVELAVALGWGQVAGVHGVGVGAGVDGVRDGIGPCRLRMPTECECAVFPSAVTDNLLLTPPHDSPAPSRFPVDQSRHEEKSVTPVTPAAAQAEKELQLPTEIRARIMA